MFRNCISKIISNSLLYVKLSSNGNHDHVFSRISLTNFITTWYESTKYIMNRNYTISTDFIEIICLNFYITVFIIIFNVKMKSCLII